MKQRGSAGGHTWLGLVICAALLAGCNVPIAIGLDESDANHAVVALEKSGVAADKDRDPDSEGHWRISVARDDASSAAGILSSESLPPAAVRVQTIEAVKHRLTRDPRAGLDRA